MTALVQKSYKRGMFLKFTVKECLKIVFYTVYMQLVHAGLEVIRQLGTAQDATYALILRYVSKIIYLLYE